MKELNLIYECASMRDVLAWRKCYKHRETTGHLLLIWSQNNHFWLSFTIYGIEIIFNKITVNIKLDNA